MANKMTPMMTSDMACVFSLNFVEDRGIWGYIILLTVQPGLLCRICT